MLFEMFDGDIVRAKECISFPEVAWFIRLFKKTL
jgi:hypothetical protein